MATVIANALIKGLRGKLGDSLVFKTMRGKTFVSLPASKPNKKKESEAQRKTRVTFREATQWAQHILLDPEKKAYYQKRAKALKLPNAYTAAITDYMRKPKVEKLQYRNKISYKISKPGFSLPEVRVTASETTELPPNVVIRHHNDKWLVSCTDATPLLTFTITDNARKVRVVREVG